jgi:hydrogenase nickel incorporation protein HypA/HybF
MHELGLAQGIVEVVSRRASRCVASRVTSVRLHIGDAAGVAPDALRFCFELLVADDPVLSGAALTIEHVPHRGRCLACGQEFTIVHFVMRCPACGQWETGVISGTELEVREMEYEAAPAGGRTAGGSFD